MISDVECQGVCSAQLYHLCQFVGHYVSLQAYGTTLIKAVYYKRGNFCLNLSTIFTENSSSVQFLNNRTGEIIVGTYLVSITEIVSDFRQIGTGALLIINPLKAIGNLSCHIFDI